MNCPGHMLLFGSQLRSYRDLPIRYAEAPRCTATSSPGRCTACRASGTSPRTTRTSSARRSRSQDEIDAMHRLRRLPVRPASAWSRTPSCRRDPDEQGSGPTSSGTAPEGALAAGARAARAPSTRRRRRGHVLRAEDRPPHDRRPRSVVADGDDPARLPDAGPVRPHVHGRRQPRAHAVVHPSGALRLVRALHRHPRGALRRRLPVLARAGAGARPAGRRGASRGCRVALPSGSRGGGFRVEVDERDETLGKRIRDAELEKVPFVVVYGDRESDDALAVRERGGEQSTLAPGELLETFRGLARRSRPSVGR